ncbi:hypothetical protein AB3N59_04195 [Leptospira sp. WS92.C1]
MTLILIGLGEQVGKRFPDQSAYYMKKDVEYCERSLFMTPCGNSYEDFIINHASTLIQSCNPKVACMGGKNHFATGTFCIDWDR